MVCLGYVGLLDLCRAVVVDLKSMQLGLVFFFCPPSFGPEATASSWLSRFGGPD